MEHVPDKEFLRKKLLAFRDALTDGDVEAHSDVICGKCMLLLEWNKVKSVHIYLPIAKRKEINTWPLIDWLQQTNPKATIAVPVMKNNTIHSAVLKSDVPLKKAVFDTSEPEKPEMLPDDFQFDVIIVPTLGFDEFNYRLGYGQGCYDKFLANQTSATKIGLAHCEAQVFPQLEHEDHDIPLDYIVTENGVHEKQSL